MSCCACSDGHCSVTDTNRRNAGRENTYLAIRFSIAAILFAAAAVLDYVSSHASIYLALYILAWAAAGYTVVVQAFSNLRHGKVFDENFLMTIATLGAFAVGQWAEGAAVMLFFNLGELVQDSAVRKSRKSITALMDVRPQSARLDSDGSSVHPETIEPGTRIRVLPGEMVPLDGTVVSGMSDLDTAALTGESLPRYAEPGDRVFAGFVNGSGVLVVETTARFSDTAAAKMLDLVEHAQERKARAEKRITAFARVYTPVVTLLALALAVSGPFISALFLGGPSPLSWQAFQVWVYRALIFLVISCPCALVISIPLGFFGGIGGAARHGILIKGADFIDVLARTKAVVLDKTGTLTHGIFAVTAIQTADGVSENDLLRNAFAAQAHSTHPLSRAIRAAAESAGVTVHDAEITHYREERGKGTEAQLDGVRVVAGSRSFLESNGVSGLPGEADGTVVHVARDNRYIGSLLLGDALREETRDAVTELHDLGIDRIVMITGDTESAARLAAGAAGITEYRAGVLPHEKVVCFESISDEIQETHPTASVLFAGDGINDAPVLARADAGIAMGAIGSDAAVEAADIVLMNDDPRGIADAIRIARRTHALVTQNIVLAFTVKALFLAGGAFGLANLWEAVFADVGVALLALANSLRARKIVRPRVKSRE